MDPPPPFRIFPQSPGALLPVSPERINQQRPSLSPAMSPEVGEYHSKHGRMSSDVQSRIAFLNSLARSGSPTPSSPKHHNNQNNQNNQSNQSMTSSSASAALQRALLGREEAESALAAAHAEIAEAQVRERKISERVESLLEQLQATKERQAHERSVFEKEVRRARKEAFRAGSTLVKTQEELKSSRGEIKGLKEDVTREKESKEKAKQEAFERAYTLAGLTEEMEALKEKLRSYETDNLADNQSDVLEARAKEIQEEATPKRPVLAEKTFASQSSQSSSAKKLSSAKNPKREMSEPQGLPGSTPRKLFPPYNLLSVEYRSPAKRKRSSRHGRSSFKENQDPELSDAEDTVVEDLVAELKWERRLRLNAEDMVHFLNMECQFKTCSCRRAEMNGTRYVHDEEWDRKQQAKQEAEIEKNKPEAEPEATIPMSPEPMVSEPVDSDRLATPPPRVVEMQDRLEQEPPNMNDLEMAFSPKTGTFRAIPSPVRPGLAHSELAAREQPPLPTVRPLSFESHPVFMDDDMEDVKQEVAVKPEPRATSPAQPLVESYPQVEAATLAPFEQENFHFNPRAHTSHAIHSSHDTSEANRRSVTERVITTKVPLHSENTKRTSQDSISLIPGTPVTREEALAQIRARRGRTQSMVKRSVSAGEMGMRSGAVSATPMGRARRMPGKRDMDTRSESGAERRKISAPAGRC